MKYAVVRINGKQYKVAEGEEFLVDKLAKDKVEAEVLLVADGDKVTIGTPTLKNKVDFKKGDDVKGEKISVVKYKAKSRYRRKMGFRSQLTKLQVTKIS